MDTHILAGEHCQGWLAAEEIAGPFQRQAFQIELVAMAYKKTPSAGAVKNQRLFPIGQFSDQFGGAIADSLERGDVEG